MSRQNINNDVTFLSDTMKSVLMYRPLILFTSHLRHTMTVMGPPEPSTSSFKNMQLASLVALHEDWTDEAMNKISEAQNIFKTTKTLTKEKEKKNTSIHI